METIIIIALTFCLGICVGQENSKEWLYAIAFLCFLVLTSFFLGTQIAEAHTTTMTASVSEETNYTYEQMQSFSSYCTLPVKPKTERWNSQNVEKYCHPKPVDFESTDYGFYALMADDTEVKVYVYKFFSITIWEDAWGLYLSEVHEFNWGRI